MDKTKITVWMFVVVLHGFGDNGHSTIVAPYVCAEFCWCDGKDKYALCDGHGNNTLENGVPQLPLFVRSLTIKSFNIESITSKTFASVSMLHLAFLNISNCTVGDIDVDGFSGLRHCRNLSIVMGHNLITERVISKAFSALRTVSLNYLGIRHLNISDENGTVFDSLAGASIRRLSVAKNYLTAYNHSKFVNVSNLMSLDLSGNDINQTMLVYSPRLKELNLAYNRIHHFPNICQRHKAMFPHLELIRLDHNNLKHIHSRQFDCLKKLKYLDLSRNFFLKIVTNTFANLANLEVVRLRNMVHDFDVIEAFAFNNSNLREINLRDNRMELQHVLHPDTFAGCHRLEQLDLSYNQVIKLPHRQQYMTQLLGNLLTLRWLSLGNLILFQIPDVVMNLTNIEVLEIFTNYISEFPVGFFGRMKKLTKLYIGTNSFSSLDESDFPLEVQHRLKVLEFSSNPFVCNCNLLWFIQWIRKSPDTFVRVDNYTCTSSDKSTKTYSIKDFNISVETCLLSFETSRNIVIFCGILTIVLVLLSLLYRWRWFIKYFIYVLKYDKQFQTQIDGDYMFDAIVIYCIADRSWIVNEAIPNLEESANLRLCIDERDFMSGLEIENTVACLIRSRKVVLVLSNEFAQSRWCQFQMCLCKTYLLENRRDSMVTVLLEEIKACHVKGAMYAILKTTTYCTWPDEDAEGKTIFWTRLRQLLGST